MNKDNNNNESNKYGFFSMFIAIVGTVIGIGIFFKNGTVISLSEGNEVVGIISWLIGALVIVIIGYLFIEIYSARKNSEGKSNSITEWSYDFLGKKGAIAVMSFWQYIYLPLTIFILAFFSTDMVVQVIDTDSMSQLSLLSIYFAFTVTLSLSIPIINSIYSKPSKVIQSVGTFIKFVPILVFLVGSVVLMCTNPESTNTIETGTSDTNAFLLVLATLPAIFFAFDGFLAVSQLQNQAKNKSTYKKALISSLFFISATYFLIAIFTFFVSSEGGISYDINSIISAISGGIEWIEVMLMVIIFISGITALSGFSSAGKWNLSTISESGLISDKEGIYTEKNSNNLPFNSGKNLIKSTACWVTGIFLIGYLLVGISDTFLVSDFLGSVDSLSNSYIIIAFFIYGTIILGALWNRKTNKVKVDKVRFFIPLSIIVSLFVYIISSYQMVISLQQSFQDPSSLGGWLLIFVFVLWFVSYLFNYYSVKWEMYPSEVFIEILSEPSHFKAIPSVIGDCSKSAYSKSKKNITKLFNYLKH